ncbi:hypothetical protein [Nonomuraea sp. C10]|uniref:hypothetical protein n=1 Tax=Nonomuraea sp. C10 TaxID=2600577 RepID=UPI0021C2CBE9|nr:hypothetical protein [Nonomuraea sp. C10]
MRGASRRRGSVRRAWDVWAKFTAYGGGGEGAGGRGEGGGEGAGRVEAAPEERRQGREVVDQPQGDRLLDPAGVGVAAGREAGVGEEEDRRVHQNRK